MLPSKSSLLSLPAELRNEIYLYLVPDRIHVRQEENIISLAACLTIELDENYEENFHSPAANILGGSERRPSEGDIERVFMRRLQSTWGPHWKCEEAALSRDDVHNSGTQLLFVCQSMSVNL